MGRSIKWLFVYGTLLSRSRDRIGDDMRRALHKQCVARRPARVVGRLYDLGGYPGWNEQGAGNNWVHGEVLLLSQPQQVFTWLDPYENIEPEQPEDGEYVRVVRNIVLASGERVRAWAYAYCGEVAGRRQIRTGRWLIAGN